MKIINNPINIKYCDLVNIFTHNLIEYLDLILQANNTSLQALTGINQVNASKLFNLRYKNHYFNDFFIESLKYKCITVNLVTESEFYRMLFKVSSNYDYSIPNNEFQPFATLQSVESDILTACILENLNNWKSKGTAFTTTYDPLKDYSLTEEENINSKVTQTNEVEQNTFNSGSNTKPIGKEINTSEGLYNDNHRKVTKTGSFKSSQELLKSELEIRNYKLLDEMFKNIAQCYFKQNVS